MWTVPENKWLQICAKAADHVKTLKGSENYQGWAAQLKGFFDKVDNRLWGILIGTLARPRDPKEIPMCKEHIRGELASACHIPISQVSDQDLHVCIWAKMESLTEERLEWEQMNGFIMLNIYPTLSNDIQHQFMTEILAPELYQKLVECHGNPSSEMVMTKFNALFEIQYLPGMKATEFIENFTAAKEELYDCVGNSHKLSDHTLFAVLIKGIAARSDMKTWIRNFSPDVSLPNLVQKASRAFENHELLGELAGSDGPATNRDNDNSNGEGKREVSEHCDYPPYLGSHKTENCFRHPNHKRKVSMS